MQTRCDHLGLARLSILVRVCFPPTPELFLQPQLFPTKEAQRTQGLGRTLGSPLDLSWRKKWQPTPVLLPGESPGTEEPGGLQSTGSQRVRHEGATSLSLSFT